MKRLFDEKKFVNLVRDREWNKISDFIDESIKAKVRKAFSEIELAIKDEGAVPNYHRMILAKHRKEWPALWKAIDRVILKEMGGGNEGL